MRPQGGRAGLILSIPVQEVSLGSPRVGSVHAQAPTPQTPPLLAFLADPLNKSAHWTIWCVKTPPLFYVVKGVPPLSPTSFGVLPLFPPEKRGG